MRTRQPVISRNVERGYSKAKRVVLRQTRAEKAYNPKPFGRPITIRVAILYDARGLVVAKRHRHLGPAVNNARVKLQKRLRLDDFKLPP